MLRAQEILNRLGATRHAENHPYEKLMILVDYIAENMEGNENDEANIHEVIFAARKNISETILHLESENNIKHTTRELCPRVRGVDQKDANMMMSMFLLSPETTVKMMTEARLENNDDPELQDNSEDLSEEEKAYQQKVEAGKRAQYERALKLLSGKELAFAAYESVQGDIENDKLNLMGYLQDDIPGKNPIGDALESCEPGFFESVFRTTSKEYKNFKATFEARQKGGASREELDGAAKAYLMHKIPGYKGDGLPTEEQMSKLSGTSRNRALLCLKTLQANQRSRRYEEKLNIINTVAKSNIEDGGLTDTFKQMRNDNSDLGPLVNEIDNQPENQAKFQQNLANDVNDNKIQSNEQGLSDDNDPVLKEEDIALE